MLVWFKRDRLGARLVVASLVVSSILSVAASGVQLAASFAFQRDDAIAQFEQVTRAMLQPLEQALWTFDTKDVDLILDGIMSNTAASYLHLALPTGQAWSRGLRGKPTVTHQHVMSRQHENGREYPLGTLTLGLSLQPVIDNVRAQFWTLLAANLIKAYLGAFALLLIIWWMVTRHLRQIAVHVENAEPVYGPKPLGLDRRKTESADELDKIAEAIRQYESRVRKSVEQMQSELRARERAEADARSALSARTRLLGTMSHEVRTPLNSLLGLLHLIASADDVPPKYREYARVGTKAGHQLLDQLANVLDMARLEPDGLDVTTCDTDIRPLAQLWADTARGGIALVEKDIEVILDLDPANGHLARIDASKVTQIVLNLLANAIKFTDCGEIRIALRCGAEGGLTVRVADTGRGIPEPDRERIFERSVQLNAGPQPSPDGSGLGLSICRELCASMNAKLELNVSDGSHFATEFVLTI